MRRSGRRAKGRSVVVASRVSVIGVLSLLASCDDPVTVEGLAGTYEASTFTVTQGDVTEDLLAGGASITLTLNPDGSTTGQLFVPDGDEDGSDLTADLAGTWTLTGSQVSLEHSADTFVRDMVFTAAGGRLSGEATFGDAALRVVLERA